MPTPNLPAVLFDLDGTLIDSLELLLRSVRHAFAGRPGRAPTDEEWIAGIGTPLNAQMREYVDSDSELEEILRTYRDYQRLHHDALTRAFERIPEVLAELHQGGHRMGLVTSKVNDLAYRSLDFVGLTPYFDTIVGLDDSSRHKPDPEPVLVALRRLGISPNQALFVGDSPHDMRAGNAAGVTTVAALWGPFSRESLAPANPAYYLERIDDLPPLIQRLISSNPPG